MSKEIEKKLFDEMYMAIRKAELKNDRTGQYDDKKMVDMIVKYLLSKSKKEVEG